MDLLKGDTAVRASPDGDTKPGEDSPTGRYWALFALSVIYMFNFMDRQLLAVLMEPVKAELNFSDTQAGLLVGTLFALFYTVVGVPMAMLADRFNRIRIISAACFVWSLFTYACGAATSFFQLALARTGVGIGEAGGTAPSISAISDYFPPERRPFALSLFMSANAFGLLIGTFIGGAVAAAHGWRAAFFIIGIIGMILGPLLWLTTREPLRGRFDAPSADRSPLSLRKTLSLFFGVPSLSILAVAGGLNAFVGNGLLAWAPSFYMRVHGATMTDISVFYAFILGGSLAVGSWVGGGLVSHWAVRNPKVYASVPGCALLLSAPLFAAMLLAPNLTWALWLLPLPMALSNVFIAPALALGQNLAPPAARSTTSAVLTLILNLVGVGLGPLFVGAVSDFFSDSFGIESLRIGLLALIPFMVVGGCVFLFLGRFVASDLRRALDVGPC